MTDVCVCGGGGDALAMADLVCVYIWRGVMLSMRAMPSIPL